MEQRFFGKELDPGHVFAMRGEVGLKAAYLSPGLHVVPWPIVRVVYKPDFLTIGADELGIVEATDGQALSSGRIFADDPAGESHNNFQDPLAFIANGGIRGKQLRFLTNGTFKINPYLFKVGKIKKTFIPEGSIGVVTASDGAPLNRLLGHSVSGHDNFQKAESFLKNGGQKGPQIDFLRPGTYNINTEIFRVEVREAIKVGENEIGVVDARDGLPMNEHEVVVQTPEHHDNFQDGEKFLKNGGQRGPQENILTPGTYYINPYLFSVTKHKQTTIKQGEVGVMISNIGKDPSEFNTPERQAEDASDDKGRTRHVVSRGFRGIQREVLGPGSYNINPLAYYVIIIPTVTRSVEWSAESNQAAGAASFDPFQVVSHDGFPMQVEVRCQYRILPENAPYVVQKIGSVAQLESNVLHPQIDGIFRAQVARSPAIAYQQNRAEEQKMAEEAVRVDLAKYRVEPDAHHAAEKLGRAGKIDVRREEGSRDAPYPVRKNQDRGRPAGADHHRRGRHPCRPARSQADRRTRPRRRRPRPHAGRSRSHENAAHRRRRSRDHSGEGRSAGESLPRSGKRADRIGRDDRRGHQGDLARRIENHSRHPCCRIIRQQCGWRRRWRARAGIAGPHVAGNQAGE
ncbi:MAG: hypothetical protein K0R10_58 [Alphaproteobacteria bacterium]|nr:hypothetical protein [Alphaproteobacteria bacterium]